MQHVIPALRITDEARSKTFYVDGLGFQVDWEHRFAPHLPLFMQISRGDLLFYLTQHAGDCEVGGLVHLFVPDVDAWHTLLRDRGVPVAEAPSETLKGLRDMTVRDPDGNTLRICTRLTIS